MSEPWSFPDNRGLDYRTLTVLYFIKNGILPRTSQIYFEEVLIVNWMSLNDSYVFCLHCNCFYFLQFRYMIQRIKFLFKTLILICRRRSCPDGSCSLTSDKVRHIYIFFKIYLLVHKFLVNVTHINGKKKSRIYVTSIVTSWKMLFHAFL